MVHVLARNWWALLIRGIAAVIFGILAFLWPGITLYVIGILFGAYAFVDGVFAIVAAVRAAQAHERWWPFVLEGIVGLVIAAITYYDVGITLFALYITIAAWAFITGILEIAAAVQLRKSIANEWLLILAGICSILFSILMFWRPFAAALAIIWIIAAYAIVFGIMMIALSFRLRAHLPRPPRRQRRERSRRGPAGGGVRPTAVTRDDAAVIVVGGGHAGVEAALAAARFGVPTMLVTGDPEKICTLPCNPSIGGSAKGQLVREIDALGGAMGSLADRCSLHARFLNESKGPAVRALRQQMDKPAYARAALDELRAQRNLVIVRGARRGSHRRSGRDPRRRGCRRRALLRAPSRARDGNVSRRQILPRRRRSCRGARRRGAGKRTGRGVAAARLSHPPPKDRNAAAHRQDDDRCRGNARATAERASVTLLVSQRTAICRSATALFRHADQRAHARARS